MKKFLYGPVLSKRFGKSLGIDVLPFKTCNFNCIYCQLGKSLKLLNERKEFYPAEQIISFIKQNLKNYKSYDFITFSGSGEPLLYKGINKIIDFLKEYQKKEIIILTNGSLLKYKEVREEVKNADIIVPSLNAGKEETFLKISRPHKDIKFKEIIEGYINLREEFNGKIYIEFMVIDGINDDEEEIYEIKKLIEKIKPDKIFINTPTRPPAEKFVKIPSYEKLELIRNILGGEIVFKEKILKQKIEIEEILNIIQKRPLLLEEISKRLKIEDLNEVKRILKERKIKFVEIEGKEYATY
jgi:wyosine [tRNA(Phe)-imidazoG37] synthetase (radical SAM superfamily)